MRVDFYVHEGDSHERLQQTACRLAEKAFAAQHRVYIRVDDAGQVEQLNDRLWTFRDGSFVPHDAAATIAPEAIERTPVLIGTDAAPPTHRDVLINLATGPAIEGFDRIAELVDADPARRDAGRERYRAYRDQGIEPQTHRL